MEVLYQVGRIKTSTYVNPSPRKHDTLDGPLGRCAGASILCHAVLCTFLLLWSRSEVIGTKYNDNLQ